MRKIDKLIVHCSATREGADYDVTDIDKWHRKRGFRSCGYHYVIKLDGTIQQGRKEDEVGAHCKGFNRNSIGVCYIGGLDNLGKGKDTRTDAQKKSLRSLLRTLRGRYPDAVILGHRDISPDTNGNGIVDPWERIKECPCFNAIDEYKDI